MHEQEEARRQRISNTLQGENSPWYGKRGDEHPATKIKDAEVAELRRRFVHEGAEVKELANDYNLTPTYVRRLVKGQARPQAPGPTKDKDPNEGTDEDAINAQ